MYLTSKAPFSSSSFNALGRVVSQLRQSHKISTASERLKFIKIVRYYHCKPIVSTVRFSSTLSTSGKSNIIVSGAENTSAGILGLPTPDSTIFEIDWTFLSPAGLGHVFHELLADLVGAPPPPSPFDDELKHWKGRGRWGSANVEEIYSQQRLRSAGEQGYLVRGVIYDVSALMLKEEIARKRSETLTEAEKDQAGKDEDAKKLERAELAKRDWQSFVLGSGPVREDKDKAPAGAKKVKVGITIDEIAVQLDQDAPEAENRTTTLGRSGGEGSDPSLKPYSSPSSSSTPVSLSVVPPQSKQQALEESMGRQESVKAKYMAKIMEKKMLADVRRDQGRFTSAGKGGKRGSAYLGKLAEEKGWVAMPGSPGLLRYFRERGLLQGVLVGLPPDDVAYLEDQLGNFAFQPATPVGPDQPISRRLLENICRKWDLKPKQVMLVVGNGHVSESILRSIKDAGFFVSQMTTAYPVTHGPKKARNANDTDCSLSSLSRPTDATGGQITSNVSASVQFSADPSKPSSSSTSEAHDEAGATDGSGLRGTDSNLTTETAQDESVGRRGRNAEGGLFGWYRKLAEGTLHVEDKAALGPQGEGNVHFRMADMTELKWVIEDLNGVSYRRSTMVRGGDKSAHSPVVVMRPGDSAALAA